MVMFRSFPLPHRSVSPAMPWRNVVPDSVRIGIALASVGAMFAMATVWLEDRGQLDFPVGLTLGMAMMPWVITALPSSWKMLPQPGAICAIALGVGTHIGLAGLYSGRTIAFGIGGAVVLAAQTFWIAATHRD